MEAATLKRLKSAEGHLKGVVRMAEEDAYCIDLIRQPGGASRVE